MPTIHAKKAPIQIDHCLEATNREPLSLQHVLHFSPGGIFGAFIIGPGDLKKRRSIFIGVANGARHHALVSQLGRLLGKLSISFTLVHPDRSVDSSCVYISTTTTLRVTRLNIKVFMTYEPRPI